jgi:hypothetical protein
MTALDWVGFISSVLGIISFAGTILFKIIKKSVNHIISEYLSELKPNHGSSLRDEIKGIRTDVTDIKIDVARLEGKFEQHIAEAVH